MGVLLGLGLAILLGWIIKCVCSGEWSSNGVVKDDSSAFSIARDQGFRGTYKEWILSLTADGESVFGPNVGPDHELYFEMSEYWYYFGPHMPFYMSVKGRLFRLGIPYRNPYVPYTEEWSLVERHIDGDDFRKQLKDLRTSYAREYHQKNVLPDLRRRVEKQMRTHRLRPARARQVTV